MITLENESSRHRKAVAFVKGRITPAIRRTLLRTLSDLGNALGPGASIEFHGGNISAGAQGAPPDDLDPVELEEMLRMVTDDAEIRALAEEAGRSFPEVPIRIWTDLSGEDLEVYTQRTQMEDLTRGFRK